MRERRARVYDPARPPLPPSMQFNSYRTLLDPKNILSNEWMDKVLPRP